MRRFLLVPTLALILAVTTSGEAQIDTLVDVANAPPQLLALERGEPAAALCGLPVAVCAHLEDANGAFDICGAGLVALRTPAGDLPLPCLLLDGTRALAGGPVAPDAQALLVRDLAGAELLAPLPEAPPLTVHGEPAPRAVPAPAMFGLALVALLVRRRG